MMLRFELLEKAFEYHGNSTKSREFHLSRRISSINAFGRRVPQMRSRRAAVAFRVFLLASLGGLFSARPVDASHRDPATLDRLLKELDAEVNFIVTSFPREHAFLIHRGCSDGGFALQRLCQYVGAACGDSGNANACARSVVGRANELMACGEADVIEPGECERLVQIFD